MSDSLRRWLSNIPLEDPLERQQAGLLQAMLLVVVGGSVAGLLVNLITSSSRPPTGTGGLAYIIILLCTGTALWLLRRGRFTPSVILTTVGITLAVGLSLMASGLRSTNGLLALAVPITLAGLLLRRNGVLASVGLAITVVAAVAVQRSIAPDLMPLPATPDETNSTLPGFIIIVTVLGLFLDRFGSALYTALSAAQAREHQLQEFQAGLEQKVKERTAALQRALQDVQQNEAELKQTLEDLNVSRSTIRELSAPVIPVLPGVLVTPLIGALDERRIADLSHNLLKEVERQRARQVILDITGVPLVDTQVAQTLLRTAASVHLLGAQTLLVGIRPEVAQTIVSLGADLSAIPTYADLREAVATIIAKQ